MNGSYRDEVLVLHPTNRLWAVTSAVGAGLCFAVLLAVAAVATDREARANLDRVSFRIVLYALIANMVFGIASAVGGSLTGPSSLCGLSVFILQLTLEISCVLLFCIALNLQYFQLHSSLCAVHKQVNRLVVVHGINSRKLERYYVAGSMIIGLLLTVPPYAAGQYGWDPLVRDCWYTNDNQAQRLEWQIGTQLFWTGLTSIGEAVAAIVVTFYMLRVHFRQVLISNATRTSQSSQHSRKYKRWTTAPSSMVIHANTYKTVIIRIALYPMMSCAINLTSIACVVHATLRDGINDQNDYNILLLSDFLYGGRAIVYALLAATDPALVRAIRTFARLHFGWCWDHASFTATASATSLKRPIAVHVELNTIQTADYTIEDS